MEPLAKTAYDAYRTALQHLKNQGAEVQQSLLEWDDLSAAEREAWDAAAQAMLD